MKNTAIFLDEYLNQIGTKKFESTEDFITFKRGTFNIRLNAFLYRNKDTVYYAYIYPTDEKLLIDIKIEPIKVGNDNTPVSVRLIKLKEKLEHGDLKLIVGENIIGQLARMAIMGLKTNWVLILIVAISVGIGAGGFGYSLGVSRAPIYINATIPFPSATPIIIGK